MKLHQKNINFTWTDKEGPFRVVSEDQARQWNKDGYFLLQNALEPALLDELASIIDPMDDETEAQLAGVEGGVSFINRAEQITFTIHLVKRSQRLKQFVTSELFANLCLDLIGDNARLYWDQAVYKKPETPVEFPWHQDNGYTYIEPQEYLTCWIPLTDATIDNGCPWVMPGVHRHGTLAHWQNELGLECLDSSEGAVPVEAKKGDVVVFSSLTPHRTGPNLTNSTRKAYIVQYSHDGAMTFPRDDARELFRFDPTRQFIVAKDGKHFLEAS